MNSPLKKTILILSANPKDTRRLRPDEEIREIEEALRDSEFPDRFELKTSLATPVADLQSLLLRHKPHIVHFCGHGETDGLLFENVTGRKQQVQIEALAELFKLCGQSIECVVLNACYSQPQADAIHQHIPCVIGMNRNIGDKAAMLFAAGFYTALGNGRSYRDAFEFGCNRIDLHNIPEDSTPVILARDDVIGRPVSRTNPYRGLFAFREEDEPFFFGRDSYTTKLVEAVQNQPLTAVIGASGSGKSSLVYAGLIPALRRQDHWLITSFRPGDNPFLAVAKTMIPFLYTDELERLIQTEKLAEQLQTSEIVLLDVITRIIEKDGQATHFLLFVDQFEELYTLCQNENERRRFLNELLRILETQSSVCKTIFTLRADFFGKALAYRPFADALQGADIVLGPMNRDELRSTIEEPTKTFGVEIEDGLTDRILDAIGDEPGNLPLLEFALTELWNKQDNGLITHAVYDEIGGVEQALASYAESVYTTLTDDEQSRAQRIFTQLVRPGEGTEDTRRIATCADVGKENWQLVTKLADARLVVTGGNEDTGETVEVVHEALIQRWQRLREWIDADREFRMWQERLRAVIPLTTGTYTKGELLRGSMLNNAADWLRIRQNDMSQTEQQFIEQSLHAKKRAQHRETAFWTLLFLAIIGVAVALFGLWRQTTEERNKALKTQSLLLTALSQKQIEQGASTLAILLALEALPKDMAHPDRPYVDEAKNQLYKAVNSQRKRLIFKGHESYVTHAAFNLDGTRVLTASWDNTARLWDTSSGQEVAVLRGHESYVVYAVFSPDGAKIVTTSEDNTVRLWDSTSGHELAVLRGHKGSVWHAAFSPDSTRIVTASWDGTARLWRVANGEELAVLEHEGSVWHAEFSPDGARIVTASWDGTARLWRAVNGEELAVLGHEGSVWHVTFSLDGTRIVTASSDNTARVWEAASGQELVVLRGHEGWVVHAAFSPNGTWIVTASEDNTARVWKTTNGQKLAVLRGHGALVKHAEFNPDGTKVITASEDNTARLWEAANGEELEVLRGHEEAVYYATFSPNGHWIVTASDDGTARGWETINGEELDGHQGGVNYAVFSPGGTKIVTASEDNTARVWGAANGQELLVLRGHKEAVYYAAFSSNGNRIVTVSSNDPTGEWENANGKEFTAFPSDDVRAPRDNTVRVWETTNGKELAVLRWHKGSVRHIAFNPDCTRIVIISGDGTVQLWEIANSKELIVLLGHEEAVYHATFSPDGTQIVTASEDKTVRIWDAVNGEELKVLRGHEKAVYHVAFNPDGTRILSVSQDNTVRIWEAVEGKELAVLRGYESFVNHAVFSPDGTRIVTVSGDGMVRAWKIVNDKALEVFKELMIPRYKGFVRVHHSVFSPDGARILFVSGDGIIRGWEISSDKRLMELGGHEGSVVQANFSPNGTKIVTISQDRMARVRRIFRNQQELIDYAHAILPRQELTEAEKRQFFLMD
ncbi:MAG: CHAT domain-containing protein [bacterium]|nr:CHAT domain-containing protein [bacterium]